MSVTNSRQTGLPSTGFNAKYNIDLRTQINFFQQPDAAQHSHGGLSYSPHAAQSYINSNMY